jgi:hypothetical protein
LACSLPASGFVFWSWSSWCSIHNNAAVALAGVRDCITAARPIYELLDAKDKLAANYPDCQHDFPPDVRKVAYEWLDRWLK